MSKRLQSSSEDSSNKRLTFTRRIGEIRSQSQVVGRSHSLGRQFNSSLRNEMLRDPFESAESTSLTRDG